MSDLSQNDPKIYEIINKERQRQNDWIELIASENFVSPAVLEAAGSILTNKYAEGYPGKRYYGGCEAVDKTEAIAIERACKLFGCSYANVQPNSGSQANQGVFTALLQPGDTILGMSLAHGGHLTHGAKVNFSGKLYNVVPYGLNDHEEIDYDDMERVAMETRPKLIIGGASASGGVGKIIGAVIGVRVLSVGVYAVFGVGGFEAFGVLVVFVGVCAVVVVGVHAVFSVASFSR